MTKAKAIEILNDEYNGCIEYREALKSCDDIDEVNDTLIALLMAIDALEQDSSNDWISVKDRRPEPNTWIMIYIKYPSPVFELERGIQEMSSIKKVFYYGEGFYCDFGTITHWMPLPEPPESAEIMEAIAGSETLDKAERRPR